MSHQYTYDIVPRSAPKPFLRKTALGCDFFDILELHLLNAIVSRTPQLLITVVCCTASLFAQPMFAQEGSAKEAFTANSAKQNTSSTPLADVKANELIELKRAAGEQTSQLRQENAQSFTERDANNSPLNSQIEDLKKAALELNRDLLILEEDLLFPANTQLMVFISVDVGEYFELDAVRLMINDEMVASHLYTQKQNSALVRGGIQRLYVGNLKTGEHEITAIFHGYGPGGREYKRASSLTVTKDQKPTLLEIKVRDSLRKQQPTFEFKKWSL